MHNYHDVTKVACPRRTSPTRTANRCIAGVWPCCPYLEQSDLYEQYNFDEPWDSPNNLQVAQQMPEVFRCPSCPFTPGGNLTNYVVIVGDPSQLPPQSLFLPNHWTKFGAGHRRNQQHDYGD